MNRAVWAKLPEGDPDRICWPEWSISNVCQFTQSMPGVKNATLCSSKTMDTHSCVSKWVNSSQQFQLCVSMEQQEMWVEPLLVKKKKKKGNFALISAVLLELYHTLCSVFFMLGYEGSFQTFMPQPCIILQEASKGKLWCWLYFLVLSWQTFKICNNFNASPL